MLLLLSILEILMFPWMCLFRAVIVSSRVSAPPPEILPAPLFTSPPPKKNLNLSDPPSFMSNPPQKFGELDPPPP